MRSSWSAASCIANLVLEEPTNLSSLARSTVHKLTVQLGGEGQEGEVLPVEHHLHAFSHQLEDRRHKRATKGDSRGCENLPSQKGFTTLAQGCHPGATTGTPKQQRRWLARQAGARQLPHGQSDCSGTRSSLPCCNAFAC